MTIAFHSIPETWADSALIIEIGRDTGTVTLGLFKAAAQLLDPLFVGIEHGSGIHHINFGAEPPPLGWG